METKSKTKVTVETTVNAPVEKAWKYWTEPDHITKWNFASDDWHSPWAKNDLRVGGKFSARMEDKKTKEGFDFGGVYDEVKKHESIGYTMDDGRKVSVKFSGDNNKTRIVETFEAEDQNSVEMQKGGWQAIMDNYKKYTDSSK